MNVKTKIEKETITTKCVIVSLVIIASISIILKLYTMDFSFPINSDSLAYSLAAISHTNGDFSQSSHRGVGWSMFVSIFYSFINSDNFLIYSNTIKIISVSVATSTIFLVYLLGRKFFNQKYSLVVAALFAFEPHLNYNSGLGLSEPLYHLVIIAAFYFLMNKDTKFIIPSLLLAGAIFWIRFNGIIFFIILIIIYFATKRNSPNFYRNLFLAIIIFLALVSPMLSQRADQFGDPLYFAYSQYVFTGSYEKVISIEYENTVTSATDYITENGLFSFIQTFIVNGIYNIMNVIWKISFPYLFMLLPFGIIFSFRAFDQEKKTIFANWIFIIISLASLIITFALIPEKRYLFFIFPFLIILCTIPIQRVTEYGLSTFSFTKKQKNVFLVLVLITVLILSIWFTLRYEQTDPTLENEKYRFAEYVMQNFNGNSLREFGGSLDYLKLQYVLNSIDGFKNCKWHSTELCNYDKDNGYLRTITITGNSVEEIVRKGENYDLKYIISNEGKNEFHGFVDEIYFNEEEFPFLVKIFDSTNEGFEKLKIKVFKVDYEKFHTLSD
tara:strand:+ start:408 stop:2072 length:1665 start_codon:yes stop_codon:yes gene_type:complete